MSEVGVGVGSAIEFDTDTNSNPDAESQFSLLVAGFVGCVFRTDNAAADIRQVFDRSRRRAYIRPVK